MLILTRNFGEGICIGDDIYIKVLKSKSGRIKLEIDAPRDVPVHREEVYERIQDEKNRNN